jgi:hypothetical protein
VVEVSPHQLTEVTPSERKGLPLGSTNHQAPEADLPTVKKHLLGYPKSTDASPALHHPST